MGLWKSNWNRANLLSNSLNPAYSLDPARYGGEGL
jgi:hypothetical protein